MMQNIAAHPDARAGAVIAVKTLAIEKQSWWHRFLHAIGLVS
jgi:hypothetical protein